MNIEQSQIRQDPTYQELLNKFNNGTFENELQYKLFEALNLVFEQPFIYKYGSPSYGIRNFIESTLFFSNPQNFNDIHDCNPKILQLEESYLDQLIKQELAGYNAFEKGLLKQQLKNRHLKIKMHMEAKNKIGQEILPTIGITCFTLSSSNNLMWSHYAANHTGVCVEYLYPLLITHFNKIKPSPIFFKVQYKKNIPFIKIDGNSLNDKLMNWISTKHSDWRYEEELRCMIHPFTSNIIKVPHNMISAVFLGHRISDVDRKTVINHVKESGLNIKVYQMEIDDELNLIPVEVES